jgi:regulator of chromosome condensation
MSTHVYVFGSGDCGQLGLGEDVDTLKRPRLHSFFESKQVSSIVAGGLHSLALSADGKVLLTSFMDEDDYPL